MKRLLAGRSLSIRRGSAAKVGVAAVVVAGMAMAGACSTDPGFAGEGVGEGVDERPSEPFVPSDDVGEKPPVPEAAAAAMNVVNEEVFAATSRAMESVSESRGLSFTETVADGDPAKNIDQLTSLMNKGVGSLFVWDVDVAAQRPVVKQFMDTGAAVFTLSNGPSTCPVVANQHDVGTQMGKAAANYIREEMGGEAKVVIFNADKLPNIVPRFQAVRDELAKVPGVDVVADVIWDLEDPDFGFTAMSSILQKTPDVDVVIAVDPVLVSALRAFEAANIPTDDIAMFGSDGAPEALEIIKNGGPIKATFAFNFPIVGHAVGVWGADWLAGKSIPALALVKAVPLANASDIEEYQKDEADPEASFESKMDTYLEPLGSISYETRENYWNSTNPQ